MTSFYLNYIFKGLFSKYGHILICWESGPQYRVWEATTAHSSICLQEPMNGMCVMGEEAQCPLAPTHCSWTSGLCSFPSSFLKKVKLTLGVGRTRETHVAQSGAAEGP